MCLTEVVKTEPGRRVLKSVLRLLDDGEMKGIKDTLNILKSKLDGHETSTNKNASDILEHSDFLDEVGTKLDEISGDIATQTSTIHNISSRIDHHDTSINSLTTAVDRNETTIQSTSNTIGEHSSRLHSNSVRIDANSGRINTIASRQNILTDRNYNLALLNQRDIREIKTRLSRANI